MSNGIEIMIPSKRGRPKKVVDVSEEELSEMSNGIKNNPRKRGRPKKVVNISKEGLSELSSDIENTTSRNRGRPKKI